MTQEQTRRSKLDIMLALLELCKHGTKKTHILYGLKLNFRQLTNYLVVLTATGMLEELLEPEHLYLTTDKGRLLIKLLSPEKS